MRRRPTNLIPGCLVVALACAPASGVETTAAPAPSARPPAPLALVATADGLAGVPVGSSTPRWVAPGAVAAPDGSAVFASRPLADGTGVELVRITQSDGAGEPVGRISPASPGTVVAAVAPGGDLVALTAPSGGSTVVTAFDPRTGTVRWSPSFEGRLEPEAFSVDGTHVFAARIYASTYHVHVLHLASGVQQPTLGPDKTSPPEDMVGYAVQAVLSPDGSELATLYRDPSTPGRTAFVHLLSLVTATTVCIDLAEPFGTGPRDADAIEWRSDGTVAVGHRSPDGGASKTATFTPATIWTSPPQRHHHAYVVDDPSPPAVPAGLGATPGFERFVAFVR